MPIYEYGCTECGKSFEEFIIRRSDEDEVACPTCRSRKVEKRMSRPAPSRASASGGSGPPPSCGPIG